MPVFFQLITLELKLGIDLSLFFGVESKKDHFRLLCDTSNIDRIILFV